MISIAADQYLFQIEQYLPPSVSLSLYDPAEGLPDLNGVNALLIRTVNPITPQSLPDIPNSLSFIGTGSSGTDHVNQKYLAKNQITFADAAGCNARSVAEYVATALLLWAEKTNSVIGDLTVGIVGAGNAGQQVLELLGKMGLSTVAYDPPREERDPNFKSSSLSQVLDADILSFHTPLTKSGDYPTYHWLDEQKLSSSNFELVINAARGGVIKEESLLKAFESKKSSDFILDVWENEPEVQLATAQQAFLKTPHIAGYSVQAKQNASKFIADALIKHFKLSASPSKDKKDVQPIEENIEGFRSLPELLSILHPIKEYESRLQDILTKTPHKRAEKFNTLRAEFPLRHEFSYITLPKSYFERFPILKKLGFNMTNQSK